MGIRASGVKAKASTFAQISCGVCGESRMVSTRRQLTAFDEAHRCRCSASWVSIDLPLDRVLELPAY